MKLDVEIDTSGNYTIYEKIGELNYRPASSMSLEEFKQYQDRQILKNYWQTRSRAQDGERAVVRHNRDCNATRAAPLRLSPRRASGTT